MISAATAINRSRRVSQRCLPLNGPVLWCNGGKWIVSSCFVSRREASSGRETHRNTRVTSLAQGGALTAVRRYLRRRRLVSLGPPHSVTPPAEVLSPAQAIDAALHSCQISKLVLPSPLFAHWPSAVFRLCVSQQTHARLHLPASTEIRHNNMAFDFEFFRGKNQSAQQEGPLESSLQVTSSESQVGAELQWLHIRQTTNALQLVAALHPFPRKYRQGASH
jgi:hypothetical protein